MTYLFFIAWFFQQWFLLRYFFLAVTLSCQPQPSKAEPLFVGEIPNHPIFVPLIIRHSDPLECESSNRHRPKKHSFAQKHQSLDADDIKINGTRFQYSPTNPTEKILVEMFLKREDFHRIFLQGNVNGATAPLICAARQLFSTNTNVGDVFCDCFAKTELNNGKCEVIDALQTTLGCDRWRVAPVRYPETSSNDSALSLPLEQYKGATPDAVDASIIRKEMATYYILWKAIKMIKSIPPSKSDIIALKTLPTWTPIMMFSFVSELLGDSRYQQLPMASFSVRENSKNPNLKDYLVAIRGTGTQDEWAINFQYEQVFGFLDLFNRTKIHRGFASVAIEIWARIGPVLMKNARDASLGHITITGHSAGAATAAVLGFLIGQSINLTTFPNRSLDRFDPVVRVVMFGSTPVGPSEFVEHLSRVAIVRSIESEFDPIPRIPCTKFPSCPNNNLQIGQRLSDYFEFARYKGRVEFGQKDLPKPWNHQHAHTAIMAWHGCAYSCWMSSILTPDSPYECNSEESLYGLNRCFALPDFWNEKGLNKINV